MDTDFSIEWTFSDDALYEQRPELLPRERIRRLYFEDAAAVWANLIRGWPALANGSPRKLPDGSRFRIHIRVVFETLQGGNPEDKARVDAQEVRDHLIAGFPSRGTIRVDMADIQQLLDDRARFKQTIVHEIGHVLGLGTLFDPPRLRSEGATPAYVGPRGSREFAELLNLPGQSIPVPLQKEPDLTTAAFHWEDSALQLDIMSTRLDQAFVGALGSLDGTGQTSVISTVSAGALEDLGYLVHMERAERVAAAMPPIRAAGGATATSDASATSTTDATSPSDATPTSDGKTASYASPP